MHPSMTTSRLRKTFHYPSSSDSNDSADELDEEHQERLISSFQTEDAQKNDLYRNVFLAIPILSALLITYIWLAARSPRLTMISLLSISSLVSSAYILKFMPIQSQARKGKTPVYQIEADKGPVERYMLLMNGALAGLLLMGAAMSWSRGYLDEAWLSTLPAIIFGITLYVRHLLAPLDLEELQKSRYELKGA